MTMSTDTAPRNIDERLDRIESMLVALVERQTIKDYYEIEEFARLVGRAAFTAREWCRLGRIRAKKRQSGRGMWVITHQELERYRRDGLLPCHTGRITRSETCDAQKQIGEEVAA
jgi:hypothetical protein